MNKEMEIEKRMKKLDELIDRDPITRHLKEKYEKINKEKKNLKETKKGQMTREMNINEDKLIERSKENIYLSRSLSKEEKEKRLFDDMKLLLNPDNVEVTNDNQNLLPTQYNLSQNYPNPFNPLTKINFDLPEDGKVRLIIYDILGREIIRLVNNEFKVAGKYTVEFSATGGGSNLASGVYFYRIEVAGEKQFVQTKRMVLIK